MILFFLLRPFFAFFNLFLYSPTVFNMRLDMVLHGLMTPRSSLQYGFSLQVQDSWDVWPWLLLGYPTWVYINRILTIYCKFSFKLPYFALLTSVLRYWVMPVSEPFDEPAGINWDWSFGLHHPRAYMFSKPWCNLEAWVSHVSYWLFIQLSKSHCHCCFSCFCVCVCVF